MVMPYATMDWAVPENGLKTGAPSPLNSYLMLCLIHQERPATPGWLAYEDEALPFIDLPDGFGAVGVRIYQSTVYCDKVSRTTKSSIRK